MALIIKGNKTTNNITSPISFHARKTSVRKFFTTKKNKQWTDKDRLGTSRASTKEQTREVFWRSKHNSGFCGTRVQVGRYAGEHQRDEKCPNCGQRGAPYDMPKPG